ncbi:MAG TPA: hypothetical protein VGA85_02040 [Dehalococcoidales bacterium]
MANAKMHSLFLENLDDTLDDMLNRPETPPLVTELQKKHPKLDMKTLQVIVATSWAILDTIDEINKSKSNKT